jgi:hypothetical protein
MGSVGRSAFACRVGRLLLTAPILDRLLFHDVVLFRPSRAACFGSGCRRKSAEAGKLACWPFSRARLELRTMSFEVLEIESPDAGCRPSRDLRRKRRDQRKRFG